jgi:hypothetical protein
MRRTIPRSQAIYPYGVGAILDWGQECFIVEDIRSGGWSLGPRLELPRLQARVRAPDGFRAPPIAIGYAPGADLRVRRFPSWLFCPRCRRMSKWTDQREAESRGGVPRCRDRRCGSSLVPMRYVAACEAGHITDVDWHRWAHSGGNGADGPCSPASPDLYFMSRGDKGATLESLAVKCGRCSRERDLRDILTLNAMRSIGQRCWGRQPWQPREQESRCDQQLRVLQRSQTAVHYAEIVSAIDLSTDGDERATAVDEHLRLLAKNMMISSQADVTDIAKFLAQMASRALEVPVTAEEVLDWANREFNSRNGDEERNDADFDEEAVLEEEWPALSTPTRAGGTSSSLVVRRDLETDGRCPDLARLIEDTLLVEKLREVRAFTAFRRIRPDATKIPPDLGITPRRLWLPAIEVYGEGIFIRFSLDAVRAWEQSQEAGVSRRMRHVWNQLANGSGATRRFSRIAAIAPRFVMVHTFSHLFMRQLCYESGYGSAAVRERLYVSEDRVGLLIYTADGDSEGSLGGLVRQGRNDRFSDIVAAALERAVWCSNDPICSEMPEHGFEKLNRASCHACALAPETSCTHLNALLDRELVIGDGSRDVRGFFADYLEAAIGKGNS